MVTSCEDSNFRPRPHDFVLPPRDDVNYLPLVHV